MSESLTVHNQAHRRGALDWRPGETTHRRTSSKGTLVITPEDLQPADPTEPDWSRVHRVETEIGSYVEPRLESHWPNLWKLRWLAGLVSSTTGIEIRVVEPGQLGPTAAHYYGIVCGASAFTHPFHAAWVLLHGIEAGAVEAAQPDLLDERDQLREDLHAAKSRIDELKYRIVSREEAAQRPPLGYVVLAKHESSFVPGKSVYRSPSGITPEFDIAVMMQRDYERGIQPSDAMWHGQCEYILGEVREVQP